MSPDHRRGAQWPAYRSQPAPLPAGKQRRRRYSGLAVDLAVDERELVLVAPAPLFARLERADDRVRRLVVVRGRVPIRRVVATADVTARGADPQVEPLPAHPQAVFASRDRFRQLLHLDLIEVGTARHHTTPASRA